MAWLAGEPPPGDARWRAWRARVDRLREAGEEAGVEFQINRVGSMITFFFTKTPVVDFSFNNTATTELYALSLHVVFPI